MGRLTRVIFWIAFWSVVVAHTTVARAMTTVKATKKDGVMKRVMVKAMMMPKDMTTQVSMAKAKVSMAKAVNFRVVVVRAMKVR